MGVLIERSASGNSVGEAVAGGDNTIAFNGGAGVLVSGTTATGNAVRTNAIFANAGLGIDLAPTGVNANDPLDADSGANGLQNFPLIDEALPASSSTTVEGSLESTPGTVFTVELFVSGQCDPSGHGEGERFLAASAVTTDSLGRASFVIQLPIALAAGDLVTATATDPGGNTSEFSPCVPVSPPLTPQDQSQQLIEGIEDLEAAGLLNQGRANSLISKLDATIASLDRGRINAACQQLRAFLNQLRAFVASGKLEAQDAQPLIDGAEEVQAQLGCP